MATNALYVGIPAAGNVATLGLLRAGLTGEQSTSDAQGRFFEATRLGTMFWLDSGSVTLASANASAGALGTLKFINGFYNPPNSGKLVSIQRVIVATVSGTPAGGFIWNYVLPTTRVSSTATGTIRSGYIGAATPSVCTPLVNVIVATLPADTTTTGVPLGQLGGPPAVAAASANLTVVEETNGSIVVPPGVCIGLTCIGAGTSHVVQSTLVWQEVSLT